MHLIILGPPGSGKSTIAKKVAKEFHLQYISPGEWLRKESSKRTLFGKHIKKIIEAGNLVPDWLVIEKVILLIQKKKKGFVLDGFPRTLTEAQAIESLNITTVIYLDVPQNVLLKRFAGRRECQKNQHLYHLQHFPPKRKGRCDTDGSPLLKRKDDAPQVVKERFRIYQKQTKPVLAYYRKKNVLRQINGDQRPENVCQNIQQTLSQFSRKKQL